MTGQQHRFEYPRDRMMLTIWRMASGDTYKVYITNGLVAVRDLRYLWEWSWWRLSDGKRVA